MRPADVEVDGVITVFPRATRTTPTRPTLLIHMRPGQNQPRAGPGGLDRRRPRRLLEALHPRRLPGRALPGAERACCCARATSRRSTCSTARSPIFGPATRSLPQLPLGDRRRRLPRSPPATSPAPIGPGFWDRASADGRRTAAAPTALRPLARPSRRRRARSPARRSTRSSPTTGRSCSARSPCTASSSWCSPASTSRSSSRPSQTTVDLPRAATRRCGASRCRRPTSRPSDISFDVRAGLVMRQIHHWAALLFLAAIVVHLVRIFFTGAFRRPAGDQLDHRRHAADPGHRQRLRRLLAARRPAVGHRPAHRLLHRAVDPGRRHVARVAAVRRRVPRARHPQPALRRSTS